MEIYKDVLPSPHLIFALPQATSFLGLQQVYMRQPAVSNAQKESGLEYRLMKEIYSLKQSPHEWF